MNSSATLERASGSDRAYAVKLLSSVCCLAGSPSFVDDLRTGLRQRGLLSAIQRHDSAPVFAWLLEVLSYQGIADSVATGYMQRHGVVTARHVQAGLAQSPSCRKLQSYWQFYGCRYRKGAGTCAEPAHLPACPLPRHDLRNGTLNQIAYSLFLFIRDLADGDLIGWIDRQLADTAADGSASNLALQRAALLEPLRNVHGVSDKVLSMALSCLLIGAGRQRPHWFAVGASFIAIDSLVHNCLHRTGILARFGAEHPYGPACYGNGGCAELLAELAGQIDARAFNATFPKTFPRFVQHAIWRYCSQSGLNVCNGLRIDDRKQCDNIYCQLRSQCDRIALAHTIKSMKSAV